MNSEIIRIELSKIKTDYSVYRIFQPQELNRMEKSIKQFGQLHPVIVTKLGDVYQLVDGFKRYYASQSLEQENLSAQISELDSLHSLGMIITYNRINGGLSDMEEAMIIRQLHKEHLLSQKEIADLLNYSRSVVCRRLSMIENLDNQIHDQIKLGILTSSHARELSKLPRGNQTEMMQSIIGNNLTTSQSRDLIIKYMQSKNNEERSYILKEPLKVICKTKQNGEIYDERLSDLGNRFLKSLHLLRNQQHILIGQLKSNENTELSQSENHILHSFFVDVEKNSQKLINHITYYIKS